MSLEFSASRLLVPIFGDSIYTWGSLIGVILAGLSIGYHFGGKLADRPDSSSIKLYSIVFSAGLYIIFIPFISTHVIQFSDSAITEMAQIFWRHKNSDLIASTVSQYGSLFATFLLLILPTLLLGIVSPYAVKLAVKSVKQLGMISGNLYSVSAIGNIIGTFLTVFVLISIFDIRSIIFTLGISLIISSSVLMSLMKAKMPAIIAGAAILFVLLSNIFLGISPIQHYSGNLIFQKETPYSRVDVVDSVATISNKNDTNIDIEEDDQDLTSNKGNRALFLDGFLHSMMNRENQSQLTLEYTKYFPIGFLLNPAAKNVLFVGGGGFSGPKYFLKTYPDVTVDVVEIDPVVIDVAEKYFDVNTTDLRMHIYNDDARNFLSRTNQDKKYDIIILDAYSRSYVPFHLMTLEFYKLLESRLTSNGIIVSNQVGSLLGDSSNLYRAAYKTMKQVFPNILIFPVLTTTKPDVVQNVILVATKKSDAAAVSTNIDVYDDKFEVLTPEYRQNLYNSTEVISNDVPILGDQYSPVERLVNPITGRPYLTEQDMVGEQVPRNTILEVNSEQGRILQLVFLGAIVVLWIYYFQSTIWKSTKSSLI